MSRAVFILLLLYQLSLPTVTVPVVKRDVNTLEVPPPEILNFMRRFGYLDSKPNDSEALYHEDAIVDAIKNIQKFGAIKQTGTLDNETLSLFSKPRCGVADIVRSSLPAQTRTNGRSKRFVIGGRSWEKRRIRYFIANWSNKLSQTFIVNTLAHALNTWARFSGLIFERIYDPSADIIVAFGSRDHGDNYPFDGAGNILAHAYYPYEMDSLGGDIHYDEDENWQERAGDLYGGVDFFSVTLHELGHSLGLGHSPVPSSIMFPYYKGSDQTTLDYDDTLALYELYLTKNLKEDDENQQQPWTRVETTTKKLVTQKPTFQGDYETITWHKNRQFPQTDAHEHTTMATTAKTDPIPQVPDICQGHFDAVMRWNGSVHIFKGEFVWKITEFYTIASGYPIKITDMFPELLGKISSIDAAYERYDGATILFTGRVYWILNGTQTIEGSPRLLGDLLGIYTNVPKIDAAMVWPRNNRTYIFAGSQFWRRDDQTNTLHSGYPKTLSRWPGIPSSLDAAGTLANGKTYFFKENLYWLYNNHFVRPERGYPRQSGPAWLGC